MKKTEEIVLFVFCFSIGLSIVSTLGLGGDQLSDLQFWNSIQGWAAVIGLAGLAVVGTIIVGYATSGTEVKLIGSGGRLGTKLAEAAALTTFALLYGIFAGWGSWALYKLPYVSWLGPIFAVFAIVILMLDITNRTLSNGGD